MDGGWLAPSSENRTDGLDFGCLYASQFDSKTSGLSWLSLRGLSSNGDKGVVTQSRLGDTWFKTMRGRPLEKS